MDSYKANRVSKLGIFICALGALFYAYEYLLRIAPSAMEDALRLHFNLSATGFGYLSAVFYLLTPIQHKCQPLVGFLWEQVQHLLLSAC